MSRFVSAGTDEAPTERDEAWQKAQQKIEATKQPKLRPGEQEGSLYETLQKNKAAKQDAFEEASRLRNQFRSLDEDEIEFLESVMESSRSKEAEVKKETKEQLEAFRKQQEDAEKVTRQGTSVVEGDEATPTWSVGPRKRKKEQKAGFGGVKVRRTSTAEGEAQSPASRNSSKPEGEPEAMPKQPADVQLDVRTKPTSPKAQIGTAEAKKSNTSNSSSPSASALGLVAYSSDEDD